MAYETSYDTGLTPFIHDNKRGKWSQPKDFFFACLSHAFKLDAVFILPVFLFRELGIFALIPYLLTICLCVIPIVFMQSFLGQFSGTGFISVFRISPIFKGIGYVSLVINLTSLAYYAVLGAIPLFYFFHTLTPTIPWSCEGAKSWMNESNNVCTYNHTEGKNIQLEIPSVEFFNFELNTLTMYHRSHPEGQFSWILMICNFLIWGMVAIIVVKPIQSIGTFLRYSCIAVVVTMGIILIRFAFLPGIFHGLKTVFQPNLMTLETFVYAPLVAFAILGPGWGSVLTMASYNKFDTNIFRYSWLLCFAQIGIFMGLAFMSIFITSFMTREDPDRIEFSYYFHSQWMEFLSIPTGLTFLELPHIWSILFFGMLIFGCLNLLIVQFLSVLTSLFDEFEILRKLKKEMTLSIIGIMALASIFFCSNYGISLFETLAQISIFSQMILNFLVLIIVVWIYGRERFQRDVGFMTNRIYSTWMVNLVRFVAPIFIFLAWLTAISFAAIHYNKLLPGIMTFLVLLIGILPWLLVPGYCIFKLLQTTGVLGIRFGRCVRPTDWYPAEFVHRRNYEDRFSDTEISHNLTEGNVELD